MVGRLPAMEGPLPVMAARLQATVGHLPAMAACLPVAATPARAAIRAGTVAGHHP